MDIASAATVAYDQAAERRHLAIRQEFLLDPDVVFLNHGSFGACPRPVFERYQAWQRELEFRPVEFLGRPVRDLLAEARGRLADYLGAGHEDVVYVSNVPPALNIVALTALGVDFYGGNLHKWTSSPKGAGFLYVRPELQHLIEPVVVSWGWRPNDPGPSVFVDQIERQATHDPAAYLSVPAAIDFQAERNWPQARAECHELAPLARLQITELPGIEPLLADDPGWFP